METELDISFMERALDLAEAASGLTSPNPIVGAVVVKDGEVIGEGYHERAGADHAEVAALKSAGGGATGATVYITMEPCCHTGKTGPCTDVLIEAGVSRVVVASMDPSAKVNGKGLEAVRVAGIEVEVLNGTVAARARRQNEAFRKHAVTGLPFVVFKSAMSLDGKVATAAGDSKWISSEASRELVHALRGEVDAIAVGIGTARSDDPLLTCRLEGQEARRQPLRVVFDSRAELSLESKLVKTVRGAGEGAGEEAGEAGSETAGEASGEAPTLVFVTADAPPDRVEALEQRGVDVVQAGPPGGRVDVVEALRYLGSREPQCLSLLLEGGPALAASFIEAGAIDKVMVFVAPRLIGGEAAKTPVAGEGFRMVGDATCLYRLTHESVGDDVLITAYTSEEEW